MCVCAVVLYLINIRSVHCALVLNSSMCVAKVAALVFIILTGIYLLSQGKEADQISLIYY